MLIGQPAIDRSYQGPSNRNTLINAALAATEAGTITKVRVFTEGNSDNLYVGIFYVVSGNTLHCRSATGNLGNCSSKAQYEFDVSLACQIGDVIGCYFDDASHYLNFASGSGSGYWYTGTGDVNRCVVDDETTYSFVSNRELSLEGEIVGAAGGGFGPAAALVALGEI